jgi:urease accessory protein
MRAGKGIADGAALFPVLERDARMTETLKIATEIARAAAMKSAAGPVITLDYEARFLRRKCLVSDTGEAFLVNLAEAVSLEHGDAFLCTDGSQIAVHAAAEPVIEIRHDDLPMIAWHIGNRHTPCETRPDCLVVRQDHVLMDLLSRLGAQVTRKNAPFRPLGGAYGHGRTHGHSH